MPRYRIRVNPKFIVHSANSKYGAIGYFTSKYSMIDLIDVEKVKPFHCPYCDQNIKQDLKISDKEALRRLGLDISYIDKNKSKHYITKSDLKQMKSTFHSCNHNKVLK